MTPDPQRLNGISLAVRSIQFVVRRLDLVSYLGFGWAVFTTLAVAVTAAIVANSEQIAFTEALNRLERGDLMRTYLAVSGLALTFGSLAVAIGWSRLVILGEVPPRALGLRVLPGSGRYFSRSLLLLLAMILLMAPGFIVAGLAAQFIPETAGETAAALVLVTNAGVAAWLCLRAWLVFPAIAVGDDRITLRRSFDLMKGKMLAVVTGTVLAWIPMLAIASAMETGSALLFGEELPASLSITLELAGNFLILATTAATSGVLAQIYQTAVLGKPQPA